MPERTFKSRIRLYEQETPHQPGYNPTSPQLLTLFISWSILPYFTIFHVTAFLSSSILLSWPLNLLTPPPRPIFFFRNKTNGKKRRNYVTPIAGTNWHQIPTPSKPDPLTSGTSQPGDQVWRCSHSPTANMDPATTFSNWCTMHLV